MGKGPGTIYVQIPELTNQCFVIMPFDGKFVTEYDRVIKPAVEEAGLECVRGDQIFAKAQIMADVWRSIRQSRAVLAELTDKNANVVYELGLAHAIGKPAIIITRTEADVPFDLKALRYIYYDTDDPFWGDNVKQSISGMLRKMLAERDFGGALEGVTLAPDLSWPDPPTGPVVREEPHPEYNVSGIWRCDYSHELSAAGPYRHHVVLRLSHDGDRIIGDATIAVNTPIESVCIVEMLTGSMKGKKVTLQGVSYTYTKAGTELFKLETYNLTALDENTLEGTCSAPRFETPVTFERVTNF